MLLLRLSGSFLLRLAERTFLPLLFHEPPRNTRLAPAIITRSATIIHGGTQLQATPALCDTIGIQGNSMHGSVGFLQFTAVDVTRLPRGFPLLAQLPVTPLFAWG